MQFVYTVRVAVCVQSVEMFAIRNCELMLHRTICRRYHYLNLNDSMYNRPNVTYSFLNYMRQNIPPVPNTIISRTNADDMNIQKC